MVRYITESNNKMNKKTHKNTYQSLDKGGL